MFRIAEVGAEGLQRFTGSQLKLSTDNKVWLVVGKNLDSNQSDSNASGKTGFFNIISFVLMGDIPGKGSEILNIGQKTLQGKGWVKLVDNKTGAVLLVSREFTKTGPKLRVELNNEVLCDSVGVKKTQPVLNKIIGVTDDTKESFKAFLNTVYLTFDYVKGFADVDTTSADRVNLLTKYLSLDKIDVALKAVRESRKGFELSLASERSALAEVESSIGSDGNDIYKRCQNTGVQITRLKIDIDGLQKEYLALPDVEKLLQEELVLNQELGALERRERKELDPIRLEFDMLEKRLAELPELKKQRDNCKKNIGDVKAINVTIVDLSKKLEEKQTNKSNCAVEAQNAKQQIERLNAVGRGYKCPDCGSNLLLVGNTLQHFDKDSHEQQVNLLVSQQKAYLDAVKKQGDDILKVRDAIEKQNTFLRESQIAQREYDTLMEKINKFSDGSIKLQELSDKGEKLSDELRIVRAGIIAKLDKLKSKGDVTALQIQRDSLKSDIDSCSRLLKQSEINLKGLQAIKNQVEAALKRKKSIQDKINELLLYVSRHDLAIRELPRFRMSELNKAVPQLEILANDNLSLMGVPFRIKLELKVDEGRNSIDFPIDVCDEEGRWRNFGTFSGGERQRIALACALAQRTLAQSAGGFLLDFVLMDEVFDGLDTLGREMLLRYLTEKSAQYFIITHSLLNDMVTDKIEIRRENGVSSFSV